MNYDIYRFGKIDSTNSYLMKLGDQGFPEGTVAVADEQTKGHGRFGRTWEAEPLSSLLFSVLLRPALLGRDKIYMLTFSAAVATAEAIELLTKTEPELKWPNDVLLGSKKVCGILLESGFEGDRLSHVVVGLGVNVNQSGFSGELARKATSLALYTGRTYDREELLSLILDRFSNAYDELRAGEFESVMEKWRRRSRMFGKKIELTTAGSSFEGIMEGVADDGSIVVRTPSGLRKFTSGEITLSGSALPGKEK